MGGYEGIVDSGGRSGVFPGKCLSLGVCGSPWVNKGPFKYVVIDDFEVLGL